MKQRIGFAVFVIVALGACTRSLPYKSVGKPDMGITQGKKSLIDTNADYVYVASTLESGRLAEDARPHYTGESKRVRFVFQEKSLQVISPEEDSRFAKNPTNNLAVLSIPIEHVEYRCTEDAYGKCTNKEEENKDIAWNKKSQFKLKPEELATQQFNFLPMEFEKYFFGCYEEVGSQFIKSDIQPDHINFILEKVFQTKSICAFGINSLEGLTFTVRYQYSFVKLNKLATPNYKPLAYTRADERNFGFFNTEKKKLDVDNNLTVAGETAFFNRWNPGRTVTYYLSEAFNRPENAQIKKATYESFAVINNGLKKAGASLRLKLKDPVAGMSSGDIRYSMIVLEEDPSTAGLLGYGPAITNPLTGEILSAKVVMYSGIMKKYIKGNYDDLIDERLAAQEKAGTKVKGLEPIQSATPASTSKPVSPVLTQTRARLATFSQSLGSQQKSNQFRLQMKDLRQQLKHFEVRVDKNTGRLAKDVEGQEGEHPIHLMQELKERREFMSKHCFYPAEEISFDAAVVKGADQLIQKFGMKKWDQLNAAEREVVISTLMPYVWTPTFIHELGHNLGLRHNFSGSTDKDNFYSVDELRKQGVNQASPYSSMMDYPYSELNALRVMGKYDIAALRYAYVEKVELEDGKEISLRELNKNPSLKIKNYSYCTDEHVGVNANCSRFDEGTSFTEMAQHFIRAYEARYKRGNLRNSRSNFSQLDDHAQLSALDGMFSKMRMMFERYESIKNDFDIPDDAEEWKTVDFLKDIRDAAKIAAQFFVNVIKTPDTTCVIADVAQPDKIAATVPIRALSKQAISCFDQENVRLKDQFKVIGEVGKSFQSRKDPSSTNPYADQIDVRGIYLDKMLAAYYLTARELGVSAFDDYTENFLDMPDAQGAVLQTFYDVLVDKMSGPVPLRDKSGKMSTIQLDNYSLFDESDADNSHKVSPLMDGGARRFLGLPSSTTNFQTELMRTLVRYMPSKPHRTVSREVLNLFRIRGAIPRDGRDNEYLTVDVNGERYFVHPSSEIALDLARSLQISTALRGLTKEQLLRVKESIAQDAVNATQLSLAGTAEAPAIAGSQIELNAQEMRAKKFGAKVIDDFIKGEFRSPSYYGNVIQTLYSLY